MPMLADAHISSLGYLWYIRNLKGFSKLKACLHVRRLKAQKSYVWTTSKPVCSKQNAFLRVVFPQGKNCDKTDGRKFQ